jgi:hypothetical protein
MPMPALMRCTSPGRITVPCIGAPEDRDDLVKFLEWATK